MRDLRAEAEARKAWAFPKTIKGIMARMKAHREEHEAATKEASAKRKAAHEAFIARLRAGRKLT